MRRRRIKAGRARRTIDRCRSPSSSASPSSSPPARCCSTAATTSAAPPLRPDPRRADRRPRRARARAARSRATPIRSRSRRRRRGARGSRRSTRTTRRRAGAPTRRCSRCSACSRPGPTSARRPRRRYERGRRRLLRPALGPAADRRGRPDRQPRALRDDGRARADPRAGGPALRLRPRAAGVRRRRRARLHGAGRGHRDAADVPLRRAPLRRRGDVRRPRGVGVPADRRPAAVPDGAAAVPVHGRRGVRRPPAARSGAGAGRS